jgi:type IV pilus assembly protein PilC
MTGFRFSALEEGGNRVSGVEKAASSAAAHLALIERGLRPVEVNEKKSVLQFEVTKKTVPRKEVMHFSRQLGVFMKAGIPIMEALDVIAEETTEKLLRKVLAEMIEALQAGATFAAAAASHPEAFPNYYIGILESAELTGRLDEVLNQLADYIERDTEARGKLTSALVYPGVILGMSVVTVVVLAAFVLPRFRVFFKSLGAKLPLTTRMMLAMSGFVTQWWYVLFGIFVALVVAVAATRRSERGKAHVDAIVLRLPVVGDLVRTAVLERICRILASMIAAGVGLPEAMSVTADAANNAVYHRGLGTIREQMMQGQGLAGPLARTRLFPGTAQQMFRVGEETGTLDAQLETAAAYYRRELDVKVTRFTSLFEPAVIVLMGVVVGFVAVALVSAMYGIYNQVQVT